MNPIVFALRHPYTLLVGVLALILGGVLMKLFFHPGTDMAQAMAYVTRSRAFMPPGTVSPFVMRFDTGSVPVDYLVPRSDTKLIGEIQAQALFRVRPMFASLPGVSAPPPFGGNQRSIVVKVDPDRLRAYHTYPEEVVAALSEGNTISPSGNARVGDLMPIVPVNAMLKDPRQLGSIPLRPGMYAYASLRADLADVLTLPRSAVATEGDGTRGYQTYCFQVEDGKARRLPVELGPGDGERVEVLRKQVRAGGPWEPFTGTEQIVRGNLSGVRDGQAVRTKE